MSRHNNNKKCEIKHINLSLNLKCELFISKVNYPFTKFIYFEYFGIIFEELTSNYIRHASDDDNVDSSTFTNLKQYLLTKNRFENKIVIVNILPGTYANSLNILKHGQTIYSINMIQVFNIKDVKNSLLHPIIMDNEEYTLIITDDKKLFFMKNEKTKNDDKIFDSNNEHNCNC
jgi:hypothetical protein